MNIGEKLNQSSDSVNKPRIFLRINFNTYSCFTFGCKLILFPSYNVEMGFSWYQTANSNSEIYDKNMS